jgi:tetratricopeptide (TPR) repeat protein
MKKIVATLLVFGALANVPVSRAQSSADSSVAAAMRRRDRGDLIGAIALLRSYSQRHPDDLTAARLLGETLYWAKDIEGARNAYEAALSRHPGDAALRLQYAQMLSETGDAEHAREVVRPLTAAPASRGAAESLLGRLAYWDGDLSAARTWFIAALQHDSTQRQARAQLREIAAATAPWLMAAPYLAHDNQPLDQTGVAAEAGWFATPDTKLLARVTGARLTSGDSVSLAVTRAEVSAWQYLSSAKIEIAAAAGILQRSGQSAAGAASDWTGRAEAGLRLPDHVTVRIRGARDAYFYTVASLRTPVTTNTATALLSLDAPSGWLGEIAVQRAWYPDDNAVGTAYAWLLVPVVHSQQVQFQLGVAAAGQNADSSRFVLANPSQQVSPSNARFSTVGVYAPYYTPSNQSTQSVLAAATVHANSMITARASGSYGVHATENAPAFAILFNPGGGGAVQRTSYNRTFSPWDGRASVDVTPSSAFTLSLSGEVLQTAFYRSATAGAQLTYHFTDFALRRVERY